VAVEVGERDAGRPGDSRRGQSAEDGDGGDENQQQATHVKTSGE
jgi:hypothetical protein